MNGPETEVGCALRWFPSYTSHVQMPTRLGTADGYAVAALRVITARPVCTGRVGRPPLAYSNAPKLAPCVVKMFA